MSVDSFALNLRHLAAVVAVAASGSVSAAAVAINLSQPALTQGLAKLEASLGTPLFTRRPDGVEATAAGRLVAARVAEAFDHLGRAMRAIRRGAAGFAQPERLLTMAQLRALLALADAGSFVAAAAATGGSQPALHRAVRDIERLTGVPLVERRGRGVMLTEAGRRVARGFRLARGAIAAGIAEIDALAGRDGGSPIVIGAMPLARARLVPTAMARLHGAHPGAAMRVIEGAHRELIDQLRDGRIDLAIGALRDPPPGPDLVQRPLFVDRLAIVARADHPLVLSGGAEPSALFAYPWIVSWPGAPLRAQWEALFAGGPLPPAPIDCGSVMIIRGLLLAGDYLTLLSPAQVWMELRSGLLALVGGPLEHSLRTIGLTTRVDWRPTAVQQAFLDLLTDVAQTENSQKPMA